MRKSWRSSLIWRRVVFARLQHEDAKTSSQDFRELLTRSRGGNKEALDKLVALVYTQLHALASRLLRAERPGHTLRPTALIHEAYLRLAAGHEAAAVLDISEATLHRDPAFARSWLRRELAVSDQQTSAV